MAPPVYLWLMAWQVGFAVPRLTLMAGLATAWGARLTFNYARKGGYQRGGEDYRWGVLRSRMKPWQFQLFNATFIAPYQNVLIFLLAAPGHVVARNPSALGAWDAALALAFTAFLVVETVADQAQWRFHQEKAARKARNEPGPDFCTSGPFRWSRHPNFFCEVSQWWVMYAFAVVATGAWVHWALAGPALLTLLFDGSTRFTESITRSKYPAYAEYQRTTSRLMPWPPSSSGRQQRAQ